MTRPWGTSRSVTSAPVLRGGALLAVVAAALLVAGLAAAPPARGDVADWRAPFTLTPGLGLVAQYGYAPPHTRNVPAFDSADRAYIRSRTAARDTTSYVATLEGGAWTQLDFSAALLAAYPDFVGTVGAGGWRSDGVVFDRQDRAYNPLTIQLAGGATRNVLLVSWDLCRTWKVFELPDGEFAVEHWVGHNEIDGPPFLAFWQPSSLPYAGRHGGRYTLWVTQPRLEGDDLVIPTPALVTNACLGFTRHSGGASFAVTHGESTWFVWPGTAARDAPGVPQYVSRYDHLSGAVDEPLLLTRTPPANDPHNTPGICLDSQGYLHVVGGTHGTAVPYLRSLSPYSSDGGWTPPEPVLSEGYTTGEDPPRSLGRQTYDSFVCDSQDTLHLVTRQARRGVDAAFEGRYYAALIHQSRPAGASWGAPTLIVVPPARGYSVYYHKLALDHRDRLFLSCSYTGGETMWADRARAAGLSVLGRAQPWRGTYRRRLLLVSEDHGASWRFATDRDLSGGAEVAPAPSRAAPARSGGGAPPGALDWLNPAPQGDQLTAIDFVDATRGWAAGTLG
ncbi:MAG: BNR-4 repeat-containing protein, partial [Thermoleophilia bacterium]